MQRCDHCMDLVLLARKLALAFANGESNSVLAAAVQALFPSAAYVRHVTTCTGSDVPVHWHAMYGRHIEGCSILRC
jgi:hypothetical protein